MFPTSNPQREYTHTFLSFQALSASAKRMPGPNIDNDLVLKRTITPFMAVCASEGTHNS